MGSVDPIKGEMTCHRKRLKIVGKREWVHIVSVDCHVSIINRTGAGRGEIFPGIKIDHKLCNIRNTVVITRVSESMVDCLHCYCEPIGVHAWHNLNKQGSG